MTLDEIILKRKSIRKYKDQPVPDSLLRQVLDAGRLAPSARNGQVWHFTAVKNAGVRGQLVDACAGQSMAGDAPVVLVLWSTDQRTMMNGLTASMVDCSIAGSFMMLKAAELGLGTCWLGMYDSPAAARILDLPADAAVAAVIPLGWPDEDPAPRPRKPFEEICDIRE